MKTLLTLIFCLLTTFAFADVTGEIIAIDKDDNGNIRVWTSYSVDGVEQISQYPKINGKSVYCSRYNTMNFLGMTDTQIKARIEKDVDIHTKTLITNEYREKATNDIFANHLGTIVGSKISNKDVTKQVDTDGDGINDKEVLIKTDGSQSISLISP